MTLLILLPTPTRTRIIAAHFGNRRLPARTNVRSDRGIGDLSAGRQGWKLFFSGIFVEVCCSVYKLILDIPFVRLNIFDLLRGMLANNSRHELCEVDIEECADDLGLNGNKQRLKTPKSLIFIFDQRIS